MATERLIVKNFGPIKEIDIEIKDVNVLIGTTGSGKSTVAKLLAIFRSVDFIFDDHKESGFLELIFNFGIDYPFLEETEIKYFISGLYVEVVNKRLSSNIDSEEMLILMLNNKEFGPGSIEKIANKPNMAVAILALAVIGASFSLTKTHKLPKSDAIASTIGELQHEMDKFSSFLNLEEDEKQIEIARLESKYLFGSKFLNSIYFPAERILISMVGSSIMGLLKNDVTIARCVKEFGSVFETARKDIGSFLIDFLQIGFSFENNRNKVTIDGSLSIGLEETSSGIQSVVPLLVVLESIRKKGSVDGSSFLVIEEPETNIYPTTQKQLTQHIVSIMNETQSQLFITTHSPYILTALDNLVQAHNAFRVHPEKESEIEKIIPKSLWLDFDNVACYFFDKGTCRSTLNHELRTLGSSAIDEVSIEIGKEFDQLTDIQFA